ncbi:MAG: neuromedin U [Betaproteobacteria bacterium]
MNRTAAAIIGSLVLVIIPAPALAQQSNEELAKAAQNPIASMISLPFQDNVNFDVGPKKQTQNVLNIQPVVPFGLNADWNVITRTIVPVISQPDFGTGNGRTDGLGDIQFSAFFSPVRPTASGWIWGAGPIVQLRTATDDVLGQGKWGLGPTAVVLRTQKGSPWVYGALVNNVWSIGGDSSRPAVNQMLIQPFVNYNFPDYPGRYLSFSPIVTADWKRDGDNTWTVPLGLGIGQIFRIGRQPMNAQVHAYWNAVRPDNAASWNLRLQVQFLFPK